MKNHIQLKSKNEKNNSMYLGVLSERLMIGKLSLHKFSDIGKHIKDRVICTLTISGCK